MTEALQTTGIRHSPMTLGTVQLGLPYGAANKTGQPSETEAIRIIHQAIEAGAAQLDCAQAYGSAENILGKALKSLSQKPVVITKLDPLGDLAEDTPAEHVRQRVKMLIDRSCQRLGLDMLDVLMLHRWHHRTSHQGVIWQALLDLRQAGQVRYLGASVQNPVEALEAIANPDVRVLQLPFNLLDWRWQEAGVDEAARKRKDLMVHARSALLQGILVADASCWPPLQTPPESYPHALIQTLQSLTLELGRKNAVDLCLAYVRGQDWIDSVVTGVETAAQLDENSALFRQPPLTGAEIRRVREAFPPENIPEQLLDPAQWSQSS